MHPESLGWAAAALMVATFACREARVMRGLAVATNLAFIGYGASAALAPVLALHMVLLPVNLWRWREALAPCALRIDLTRVPSCCALRYSPLGRPGGLMPLARTLVVLAMLPLLVACAS